MPVCPLCESAQAEGDACAVCGRPFPRGERAPAPVAPVEGLEATLHPPVPEPRDALAELEPTAAAPAADPGAAAIDGLEATGHGPVGEVAPEPLELEPTHAERVPDDGARGPMTCRYCRTPATGWETLCLRCGMRLPVLRLQRRAGPVSPSTCGDCGSPAPGPLCPACGARQARGGR